MTSTDFLLHKGLQLADDDTDHWVCCIDRNLTYCGKDGSNLTQADFDQASCVMCENAMNTCAVELCPLFPNFQCPPEEDEE